MTEKEKCKYYRQWINDLLDKCQSSDWLKIIYVYVERLLK